MRLTQCSSSAPWPTTTYQYDRIHLVPSQTTDQLRSSSATPVYSTARHRRQGTAPRTAPHCRIEPFLDQGGSAALRRARPRSHRAAALGGRPGRRAGQHAHDPMIREAHRQHYRRCELGRLPRRTSVPVAAAASRAPTASHAIASRPLTRRPLTRDSAPMRKLGEK